MVQLDAILGSLALLQPGLDQIEALTGVPVIGVIPYIPDLRLDEEDSATRFNRRAAGQIDICVVKLPRISNFTDFDAFRAEPDVSVRYIASAADIGAYVHESANARSQGGYGLGGFGPAPEGMAMWIIGMVAVIGAAMWIGARA